jgi:hypothetical protein
MASSTSAVPYVMASSAARTRWARVLPRESPTMVPRASGSQWGAPSPTNAGTKYTPPLSSIERARASDSGAVDTSPSPSRTHCTAAPAMKMDPSRA